MKIAVILKGGEAVAHAAAPEEVPEKSQAEKSSSEKKAEPKAEAASVVQKPKSSPPSPSTPPKQSPTEPHLPPKDRERRVSNIFLCFSALQLVEYLECLFQS